ncbi:hypothetical protein AAV94_12720 [Lampropedia cohaerens]|uniref:Uncharacterized protein n=2 Tax=Lampropedia cohaerens TaxID=1610491 RepID=A0A0U1PWM7_9BURK|nr:hypothetical protein AAV94_12720 [Lampropedia cohaerens]
MLSFIEIFGKYRYATKGNEFPEWGKKIYINRNELEEYELFFSADELREDQLQIIATTLRERFDNKPSSEISPYLERGNTRLASIAEKVNQKYASEDTWPLQKQVTHWLKEEFKLSNREAEAIDLITRPDHLRK